MAEGPEGLAQPVVDAMAKAISDGDYRYALFGGGLLGFEIGAGLAARLDAGERPDFLASTRHVREGDWKVAPLPAALDAACVANA